MSEVSAMDDDWTECLSLSEASIILECKEHVRLHGGTYTKLSARPSERPSIQPEAEALSFDDLIGLLKENDGRAS